MTVKSQNKSPAKKAVKKSRVMQTVEKVAEGLGSLVWWEFTGCRATPIEIESALLKANVNDIRVPDINATAALKQATRDFRFNNGSKYKAEIAKADDKEVIVNVLMLTQVSDSKKEWHEVDTVVWDVGAESYLTEGALDATGVGKQCTMKLLELIKLNQEKYDHRFIRPKIIQEMLNRANAISIRNRGGFEYVSNTGMVEVRKLKMILNHIDGITLFNAVQKDCPDTKASIGSCVRNEMQDRIKSLEDKINGWQGQTRNLNKNSVPKALAEFADIKAQTETFAEALSFKADEMLKNLAEMKVKAESLIEVSENRDRGVAPKMIARFQGLLDQKEKYCIDTEANIYMIPMLDLAHWPKGAQAPVYYDLNRGQSGARTLAHMGFQGSIKDDHLMVVPLAI